jgi:hypothetical protein
VSEQIGAVNNCNVPPSEKYWYESTWGAGAPAAVHATSPTPPWENTRFWQLASVKRLSCQALITSANSADAITGASDTFMTSAVVIDNSELVNPRCSLKKVKPMVSY